MSILILGVLFAFMSATSFALNAVATRRGVLEGYVYPTVLISILIGVPMYLILSIILSEISFLDDLSIYLITPFIIAGILHFVIGRHLLYTAIHHIGASSSLPIIVTSQVIAAFLAIPLLNERITFYKILGLFIAAFGIGLIASIGLNIKVFKKGVALAISSASIFASTSLLVRYGLTNISIPILGVLISYVSATPIYLIPVIKGRNRLTLLYIPKEIIKYIIIAGIFVNLGQLFRYLALNLIEVSVAAPLIATIPIQTIFFSYLINREIEVINAKVVVGAITIFIGIILVLMGH